MGSSMRLISGKPRHFKHDVEVIGSKLRLDIELPDRLILQIQRKMGKLDKHSYIYDVSYVKIFQ